MDRSYRNRLLRNAVEDPAGLLRHRRFWKKEFWPHYLRRCDDVVFGDPQAGLELSKPAPMLAAKIVEASPGVNGADFMLLAYSYLGSAFRRTDDYEAAEESFRQAGQYTESASATALAEYLRRLAYLRLFKQDPECFPIIGEAIDIHKRGNLVDRHALGECLVCRARAFVMFNQHGKSFDDYTAALSHVSINRDPKPYYAVLHSLATWAVEYGTDEQLETATENLKAALGLLGSWWGSPFAKLKLRWLKAVIDMRLGAFGSAEEVMLEVRRGLADLKLSYEVGMLSMDLALLYLYQGRIANLEALLQETVELFDRLGVEAKAQEALAIWQQAHPEDWSDDLLKKVRGIFLSHAAPIPSIAA